MTLGALKQVLTQIPNSGFRSTVAFSSKDNHAALGPASLLAVLVMQAREPSCILSFSVTVHDRLWPPLTLDQITEECNALYHSKTIISETRWC